MSLDAAAGQSPVVTSLEPLIDWLRVGEKPVERHRIGLETEKLAVRLETGAPVPIVGDLGLAAVVQRLAAETGGRLLQENGTPVGIDLGTSSVAFEPGGQLELSGAPYAELAPIEQELKDHVEAVRSLGDSFGIAFLSTAFRPFGPRSDVPWLPRGRYALMRRRLPGGRAHDMMQMTASVQANFDFADEGDLAVKVSAATALSPLVAALFANSPLHDGRPSGLLSQRYGLWSDVDPHRCGLLRQMYEPGFSYEQYVRWIVSVPLLFVRRQGRFVDPEGRTFADLMRDGLDGEPATVADFVDALSTLFPDVRVKRVIEVRSADAVSVPLSLALAALWTGVLYDRDACEAARRLMHGSFDELVSFAAQVPAGALRAEFGGRSALTLARELLAIADEGLRRRHLRGHADERRFLDPLRALVERGTTEAEQLLALVHDGADLPRLIAAMRL